MNKKKTLLLCEEGGVFVTAARVILTNAMLCKIYTSVWRKKQAKYIKL